MCGILYVEKLDHSPAHKSLIKRFHHQRARGTEGFGYAPIENGFVKRVERAEKESEIRKVLEKESATAILFHHRWPTSTPNFPDMTHPIVVDNPNLKHVYYLIHNGVISNTKELKKKHDEMGFQYTTDMYKKNVWQTKNERWYNKTHMHNDSESLAVEVALYIEGKKQAIETTGAAAFICLETLRNGKVVKLHWGTNGGNPLMMERKDKKFLALRSTGGGEPAKQNTLYTMDYKTKQISERDVEIGKTYYSPSYSTNYNSNYCPGQASSQQTSIGFGSGERYLPMPEGKVITPAMDMDSGNDMIGDGSNPDVDDMFSSHELAGEIKTLESQRERLEEELNELDDEAAGMGEEHPDYWFYKEYRTQIERKLSNVESELEQYDIAF